MANLSLQAVLYIDNAFRKLFDFSQHPVLMADFVDFLDCRIQKAVKNNISRLIASGGSNSADDTFIRSVITRIVNQVDPNVKIWQF